MLLCTVGQWLYSVVMRLLENGATPTHCNSQRSNFQVCVSAFLLCVCVMCFYGNRDGCSIGFCAEYGMELHGPDGAGCLVAKWRSLLVECVWSSAALFPRRPAWVGVADDVIAVTCIVCAITIQYKFFPVFLVVMYIYSSQDSIPTKSTLHYTAEYGECLIRFPVSPPPDPTPSRPGPPMATICGCCQWTPGQRWQLM